LYEEDKFLFESMMAVVLFIDRLNGEHSSSLDIISVPIAESIIDRCRLDGCCAADDDENDLPVAELSVIGLV
jgi:hypothetical protein